MRTPGSLEGLEQKRLIAATMFEQGLTPKVIAVSLSVDDQTVRRWRRVFDRHGRDGLRTRPHRGRAPRLSHDQRQELLQLLLTHPSPRDLGLDADLWTQQRIADLIAQRFGVSYHHDTIGVILGRLGLTHQKPARRAREADPQRIEAWRTQTWTALEKKVPSPKA